MPRGKGTYGSKVGRPPKKKYYGGGSVDPFSSKSPESVPFQKGLKDISTSNIQELPQELKEKQDKQGIEAPLRLSASDGRCSPPECRTVTTVLGVCL